MKDIYLVTGVSGFIGFHLAKTLLNDNKNVIGIDNMNDYYDVKLKKSRLSELFSNEKFKFYEIDIANFKELNLLFKKHKFSYIINLAAQAGVRYSITNPKAYIESNIVGMFNILEMCKKFPVKHLVYASSSSVYGSNKKIPFEETDFVDNPVSLYAATKKSNELMAFTYSHLYKIPATGLRFFTVYGPYGRPDMAYFKFLDLYFKNQPITIYNNKDIRNDMFRDFTYIEDIVKGIVSLLELPPSIENSYNQVLNIGNNNPVRLMHFIETLEACLSKSLNRKVEFIKRYEPIKPGDVHKTYASIDKLYDICGFKPTTSIEEGLQKFTDWYIKFYNKE